MSRPNLAPGPPPTPILPISQSPVDLTSPAGPGSNTTTPMPPPPPQQQPSSSNSGRMDPPSTSSSVANLARERPNASSSPAGPASAPSTKRSGASTRQTVSCAECKRLKLRCSRSWPCTSCVRRGCAQLCPSLSMVGGKGRRLILADTEELHARVAELERALAEAHAKTPEGAQPYAQPHPLLKSAYLYAPRQPSTSGGRAAGRRSGGHELEHEDQDSENEMHHAHAREEDETPRSWFPSGVSLGNGGGGSGVGGGSSRNPRTTGGRQPSKPVKIESEDAAGAGGGGGGGDALGEISLGTLTIGQDGEAQYVGNAAGSSFLHEGKGGFELLGDNSSRGGPSHSLGGPGGLGSTNRSAPYSPGHDVTPAHLLGHLPFGDPRSSTGPGGGLTLAELWAMLPAWSNESDVAPGEADGTIYGGARMVACYFENVTWMYDPVPRPILDNDYLPTVYARSTHPPSAHKLACVYFIMSLGVMFDLEHRDINDPLADELARLGALCLSTESSLLRPTTASVQALLLLSQILLNRFPDHGQGASHLWPLIGVCINSITALGLHRNFADLSPYEQEERRRTLWEALTVERLQAMCFARPHMLLNRFIDTPYPGLGVSNPDERFEDRSGYFRARYELIRLMEKVILEQTRITRGSYKSVLEIDEEIVATRGHWPADLVPHIKSTSLPLPPDIHPHIMMQRFSIRMIFREARIYLHRTYFAKALQQQPEDPSGPDSKFGQSFLIVFESAVELLATVRQSLLYHASLTSRWSFFHFHAYSAAICLAAVCIQAPNSAFASPAYMSLVLACDLAEAASEHSTARAGLRVLQRLRHRASRAIVSSSKYKGNGTPAPTGAGLATATHAGTATHPVATPDLSASPGDDDDLSHLVNRPSVKRINTDHGASPTTGSTPDLSRGPSLPSGSPTRGMSSSMATTASQSPPSMPYGTSHSHYLPGALSPIGNSHQPNLAYDIPQPSQETAASRTDMPRYSTDPNSWQNASRVSQLNSNAGHASGTSTTTSWNRNQSYNPLLYSSDAGPFQSSASANAQRPISNTLAGFDGYGMQPLLAAQGLAGSSGIGGGYYRQDASTTTPYMGMHRSYPSTGSQPERTGDLTYGATSTSPLHSFSEASGSGIPQGSLPVQPPAGAAGGGGFFFDDNEFGSGMEQGQDIDMAEVLEPAAGGFEDVERFIESLQRQ